MTDLVIDTPEVFEPLLYPSRYKGAYGGRGCVHPDTLIDTPSGQIKIKDFQGGAVYSYCGGEIVIAQATKPLSYDEQQLYLVELQDGRSISVTDEHRFLTSRGWVKCCDLSKSDEVVVGRVVEHQSLPCSNSASYLLELLSNARRLIETPEDCLGGYFSYLRQYGQQLPSAVDSALSSLQQPVDAQQRTCHELMRMDDSGFLNKDNLLPLLSLLSSQPSLLALEGKNSAMQGNYSGGRTSEQLSESFLSEVQFHVKTNLQKLIEESCSLPRCSCILKSQGESLGITFGTALCGDSCNPLFSPSCNHDNPILVGIKRICKHDRLIYWDLHVPVLENYLSNGIVNHNSGKSHFFAESLVERCILNPGTRWACIREVQKSLEQSVKRLLEDKIQTLNVGHLFDIRKFEIETPGGGVIIFQGMQNHTADSIKSLEGFDGAWVEEAQSLSQRSLDLLRPTIRKDGSELWFSWNPNDETDPIDAFLRSENPPPDSVVIKVNYTDNPWLPEVLKAELEYDKARDYEKYLHVWEGEYVKNSNARVFKNWTIEEFERPEGTVFRLGADWGFATDPSVLIRCSIDQRRLYIDYEAYMVGCEIDQLPDLFDRVPESRKWFITADSARPETISYMRNHGYPKINSAIKGARSVEEGVEFLKSFDIVVHPRCVHTIDELKSYSYKIDDLTGDVLPILADKDNHVIDALRYALEGMRKAVIPKDKQSVTRRVVKHGWMR